MADLSLAYLRQVIKNMDHANPWPWLLPLDPSRPQGHLSETAASGSADAERLSSHIE